MENRDSQNSGDTGSQSDISKAQSQQQPTSQDGGDWKDHAKDPLASEGQASTGQADYGSAEQSDTLTETRSDDETAKLDEKAEYGEADGFIGTQGASDTSSELVENDENIPSDGE